MADDSFAEQPTSVYRYYDRRGIMLYVGITEQGIARNRQHNRTKEWWQFVAFQDVEHHGSKASALQREGRLIRAFKPPFNKYHNDQHAQLRAAYLGLADDALPKLAPMKQLAEQKYRIALVCNEVTDTSVSMYTLPQDSHIVALVVPRTVQTDAMSQHGLFLGHLERADKHSMFYEFKIRLRKCEHGRGMDVFGGEVALSPTGPGKPVMLAWKRLFLNVGDYKPMTGRNKGTK